MTLVVKHAFVSGIADDPSSAAAGEVLPSHWDASHTLTGTADASQLNGNVVQGVTNDTNVTGSILAQNLTFSWFGQLSPPRGGTGLATYALGDTIYASAANTMAALAGNIAATRKFLRQTGTGTVSAAPAWDTIQAADVPASALTGNNDTNVTLTLGGSPAGALLAATSITLGWTGTLGVSRGGAGADLSLTGGAHQVLKQSSLGAAVTVGQLAFSDISGIASAAQLPNPTASTLGGVESVAAVAHNWINSISTSGIPLLSQPSASDLSNGVTGSGAVVLTTSPTLVTPNIGSATGASLVLTGGGVAFNTSGQGILGTATNDSAATGIVGEFITSVSTLASSTVTISNASPAVISWTAHGLNIASPINFTTTGSLPTGLTVGTKYYVSSQSLLANSFTVSTSVANALAGISVNTSSAGSGTHTAINSVPILTATPTDVTGISLTAGDWDVWGSIFTQPIGAVSQTLIYNWVSSSSATLPTVPFGGIIGFALPFVSGQPASAPVSPTRFSLASTTTIYLSTEVIFSGGTSNAAYGIINARRRR